MKYANEVAAAFYMEEKEALEDRKLFVHNLGEILKQTREGIASVELDDHEIVIIEYQRGGYIKKVNVCLDSYMAIIRDVVKNI